MHPKEQIMADIKTAMKEKDAFRRDTLRSLSAAIKQVEIDSQKELSPEDVLNVIQKEVKRYQETLADLEKAGRKPGDEQKALELISTYLPPQLDRAAIEALAKEAIVEAGATSSRDMGKVMGKLMPRVKGQADGKLVNEVVRGLLNT